MKNVKNTHSGHLSETCTGTSSTCTGTTSVLVIFDQLVPVHVRLVPVQPVLVFSFDQFSYFGHNLLISYSI